MFDFLNSYWNSVQEWWKPPPTVLSPYEQLIHCLHKSDAIFETKHSQQKMQTSHKARVYERLAMMYTSLLQNKQKLNASQFYPTLSAPLQYIPPQKKNQPTQQQSKNKQFVSICGKLKVQKNNINCFVFITILLHQKIEQEYPIIFIRNSKPDKGIPNLAMQQYYRFVAGGASMKTTVMEQKIEWKKYNCENLYKVMVELLSCLEDNFPFKKRPSDFQYFFPPQNQEEMKKIEQIQLNCENVLHNIQNLEIMRESLIVQNKYLKQRINDLEKSAQIMQNNEQLYSDFAHIQENQELLELICTQKASKDCQNKIQQKLDASQITYQEAKNIIKQYMELEFQAKFKINLIVQKLLKCGNQ